MHPDRDKYGRPASPGAAQGAGLAGEIERPYARQMWTSRHSVRDSAVGAIDSQGSKHRPGASPRDILLLLMERSFFNSAPSLEVTL